jgi:hypothetical protein
MASPSIITFPYNGSTYTAEVKGGDGSLYFFVPDQTLHHILPEGKTTFKLKQGFELRDGQLTPQQDLILSILGAMEE